MSTMTSANIVDLTGQKIDLTATWIGWATWWEASLDMGSGITTIYMQPVRALTKERSERAIANLDGLYYCYLNEVYHEIDLRVGTVVPEGFAAITRYGSPTGNNVSIDVGDRTTEIIFASGFKLVSRDSEGRTYGVRQVIENIIAEINTNYGRVLEIEEVRVLLKAYTAGIRLPRLKVPKGAVDGYLDGDTQREIITRKVITMARALAKFVRAALNREGAEIGSNLDTATIYGGGGYIFYGPLRDGIPGDSELENGVLHDLYLPPEAEYLNAAYMQELVGQQTILKPTMWERRR